MNTEKPFLQNISELQRVTFVRPGGNDTAIVWDAVARVQQPLIALQIQDAYPTIEQVMFAEKTAAGWHGQMAGGEFCGNATRALGYLLLGEADGQIQLSVSGAARMMSVCVQASEASTQVPVNPELSSVVQLNEGDFLVRLQGISFLVTPETSQWAREVWVSQDVALAKRAALALLDSHGLTREPACGLIIVHAQEGSLRIDPFVFVRNTQSLYYETGCGSGSTAVGVVQAFERGVPISNLRLQQPSGLFLSVTVDRDQSQFLGAEVSGPIEVLRDGPLSLADIQRSLRPQSVA
jgi:diaminopimelate epimerase